MKSKQRQDKILNVGVVGMGGHGGGDPRILDNFLARIRRGEHSCPGAVDARNSAAIAITAAKSSETHLPVIIPRYPFRS